MKILMSALACEPGKGSELEVGFRALLVAASRHDVWILTNSATIPVVQRAVERYPWADRVHLEGIPFEVVDELYSHLTAPGFHIYYDRWQRRAAVRAAELARQIDFDIVHHVTLAASWTRAGVTAVDKPLVFGPVGGGVETPPRLLGELGWRGLIDEAARLTARRVLGRFGPARVTQRRAAVVFVQNDDTLRVIRSTGRVQLLPNATAVDLQDVDATGPRRSDIIFAARLLPWKGGRLAVRALRYVRHPGAVLRIFGDGPERYRIAYAARKWGVADRVRFEGRVARAELLKEVATAGTFLHPAFHDEAGLAVAEALSLGTPVVCLDHGGPAVLLRHWPAARATAVPPHSPERTARALATAIDRLLGDPPPVRATPHRPNVSFAEQLLTAYDTALQARDSAPASGWAFPAGNPQVFADTPRGLSHAIMVYGFGRRLPRWIQAGLSLQVRVPLVRRAFAEPTPRPVPVCGWARWRDICEEVQRRNAERTLAWVHFRSPWGKARSNMLALARDGTPRLFVVVAPKSDEHVYRRIRSTASFRVAECTDSFSCEDWSVRQYEPLPRLHRPAKWNADRMRRVAKDVSVAMETLLVRSDDIPAHWRPMHGDYVPWNLREDERSQLWLLDWEDAGWGPPDADVVRYLVAYHSLGWSNSRRIADEVKRTVENASAGALIELATFWLSHANLQLGHQNGNLTGRRGRDAARAALEVAAFRVLAAGG